MAEIMTIKTFLAMKRSTMFVTRSVLDFCSADAQSFKSLATFLKRRIQGCELTHSMFKDQIQNAIMGARRRPHGS